MRILVTGGTGFLGGHLVRRLQAAGHVVRALGRDEAKGAALRAHGIDFVRTDLGDREAVMSACRGMEAVFHVAALSAPWGPRREFHRVNVVGTEQVIAGCQASRVSRLIHVSSPSVVFDGSDHVELTEAAPYSRRFLSHYAATKKLAEDRVRKAQARGLPTIILRPKALFGPGDTTLLPRLLEVARQGRLPQIGDGTNRVDLTYVDNVVHALMLALEAPAHGNIYTITNGEHPRLWDVIRLVLDRVGIQARLRPVPYRIAHTLALAMEWRARLLGGEPLLTRYTTAILARTQTYDISAARRDLGYEPIISVAAGIERTLEALKCSGPAAIAAPP